ncbi:MAG: type IV toxin-antitoxin system AbiEi family antitoxin [Bacteroidales bacterium]|jgi:predicted transcriptional regulator of viral defense system|nr:type IV toxin-antitoxin system AbiEi family antitoxin [Bacteroidales bacterium]
MERETLLKRIEKLPWKGQYFFTYSDVEKWFPDKDKQYLRVALSRLTSKGKIISPWRNFYVVMPTEYALVGKVPPIFYIGALMRSLDRDYYICLLSAAAMYGSSHQSPQSFSVMVPPPHIRSGIKNGTKLNFYEKKELPYGYVNKIKNRIGYINVSSPELTVLDLIEYQAAVGGLSRAVTVIEGLRDKLNFEKMDIDLYKNFHLSTVQRLGYVLDTVIGLKKQAEAIYSITKYLGYRKTVLKVGKLAGFSYDEKWKIIVNQKIEVDE